MTANEIKSSNPTMPVSRPLPIIEMRGVVKGYGSGVTRTDVLKNVNLNIREGEFLAECGFSGCGKTTFMQLLAGLIMPDQGVILMEGEPITGPDAGRGLVGFAFAASISQTSMTHSVVGAILTVFALCTKFVLEIVTHYFPQLGLTPNELDHRSQKPVPAPLPPWLVGRISCAVVGIMMLALVSVDMTSSASFGCQAFGFTVPVLGEFAERYLYFASFVYDRMPGTLK